ncbi:Polysaccharide deacetylase [Rubripirellula obstinata]|uniref:Polysaccharide deacetylase n=1 Tax=Rubripirellula obstinata TaxID=406547 RepID=A0A5B1CJT9_9BACT|nr:polysaccharide deacetylase family protein [Rubripirellula obstinata]KAA1259713.1 Polysaccharide deacetylase [Rubripirellula obstinata]
MSLPIASLSLDLDNKWAYLRAAGREDWESRPGYLPMAVNRITEMLGELNLPLTVFTVGRDLVEEEDCQAIQSFDRLPRWEPANHSLNHLPWMHTMDEAEIADEIEITDARIREVTGRRPLGFRGPGFSCPDEVLRVLAKNNYAYDASIFPTSIAPIARAVFLMKTDLKGQAKENAKKLYGGFASLRQPNHPFQRNIGDQQLWEMPVTVMPLTRTPIHFSYFTFLASFSTLAAKAYFRSALSLCKLTGTSPSLLLHPPDFLGQEDDSDMAYFPGMKMARQDKLSIVRWGLKLYSETFDVRCMIDALRLIDPDVDPDLANLPTNTPIKQPATC